RLEHHLGQPGAIAQIDEHAAAVIAARRHPAKEHHALAAVAGAQRAAIMGPLQVSQELGHGWTLYGCRPLFDFAGSPFLACSGAGAPLTWQCAPARPVSRQLL